jgi:hypothetical protein
MKAGAYRQGGLVVWLGKNAPAECLCHTCWRTLRRKFLLGRICAAKTGGKQH